MGGWVKHRIGLGKLEKRKKRGECIGHILNIISSLGDFSGSDIGRQSNHKVEIMVRQAQIIYCVFITGHMFRPIYRSFSGLLTRESVRVYVFLLLSMYSYCSSMYS